MDHDEYVNEIVIMKDKKDDFYLNKKYKTSLDYEKLKSDVYINYKLKDKITNFLIPLNLSSNIIEEIFLLTKKFKFKISENKLIPIASYIVIKDSGLNISSNELFKILKLKKSWYIKYAKYLKDNKADINQIQVFNKKKKREEIIKSSESQKVNIVDDKKENKENEFFSNENHKDKDENKINDKLKISDNNESKSLLFDISTPQKNRIEPVKRESKEENFFLDIQKNFFPNKSVMESEEKYLKSLENENDIKIQLSGHESLKQQVPSDSFPSNKPRNNISIKFNNLFENSIFESIKDNSYIEENFDKEKNILIDTFKNYLYRLRDFMKNNITEIKNYFISDIGENSKKNKNFSHNILNLDEKIDKIYSKIFEPKNCLKQSSTCTNQIEINRHKEGTIGLNFHSNNHLKSDFSFDYIAKLEEISIESKRIINEKLLFLRNLNLNKNIICISLLRYLLEFYGIKIKLEIFRNLFNISKSSISKACKIFKENNLL